MITELSNEELSEKSQKRTGHPDNDKANKEELFQKKSEKSDEQKPDSAPAADQAGKADETTHA